MKKLSLDYGSKDHEKVEAASKPDGKGKVKKRSEGKKNNNKNWAKNDHPKERPNSSFCILT